MLSNYEISLKITMRDHKMFMRNKNNKGSTFKLRLIFLFKIA